MLFQFFQVSRINKKIQRSLLKYLKWFLKKMLVCMSLLTDIFPILLYFHLKRLERRYMHVIIWLKYILENCYKFFSNLVVFKVDKVPKNRRISNLVEHSTNNFSPSDCLHFDNRSHKLKKKLKKFLPGSLYNSIFLKSILLYFQLSFACFFKKFTQNKH